MRMNKLRFGRPSDPLERRSGLDRRRTDASPPGNYDRRRGVESRKPEVVELEISTSDWAQLADLVAPASDATAMNERRPGDAKT